MEWNNGYVAPVLIFSSQPPNLARARRLLRTHAHHQRAIQFRPSNGVKRVHPFIPKRTFSCPDFLSLVPLAPHLPPLPFASRPVLSPHPRALRPHAAFGPCCLVPPPRSAISTHPIACCPHAPYHLAAP
ncbi:hypothetical protein EVG20_g8491 [Dentipellis fragilis]|uniref:Uncharacterized protein n=1 Tax=Dentipellis fragilis TaxID=205917 RepID=A0A4Y9Y7P3_9AGAM|nr:hypothetical protein EVG20_g8491 [Dentipellis fragilis]